MNSKIKYLAKNTGILAISQFSSKILVFLLVPLYTSILSTEEYGVYDLAVTTVSLLFPILTANIVDGVMRFLMDKENDQHDVAVIGLRYILRCLVVGLSITTMLSIFKPLPLLVGYEWLVFLFFSFYSWNQFLAQYAKGCERVADIGISGILSTLATVVFNVMFLLVFKQGLHGFFYANIIGQLVPACFLSLRMQIWEAFAFNKSERTKVLANEMLRYSAPLLANTLAWWVNTAADKYVVTLIVGVSANGLLSVAYKVPTILNTLQSIFTQSWQISAVKEFNQEGVKSFYKGVLLGLNVLLCISCSILILANKCTASLLFAKDFYAAWQYVPFLLVSTVINGASGIVGPILLAQKKTKPMAYAGVAGVLTNIGLNFLLVTFMGIQGAAIATLVSSVIIYAVRTRVLEDITTRKEQCIMATSWLLLTLQATVEIYIGSAMIEVLLAIILVLINVGQIKTLWKTMISRKSL